MFQGLFQGNELLTKNTKHKTNFAVSVFFLNFAKEIEFSNIMGSYINVGNTGFQSSRSSEYIDKSGLISVVNQTLFTKQRFSCVTRCRRFGKSMAAEMLCAYYDQSCDSRRLFADLEIANDPHFEEHLNKYPVIYLDLSDFVTRFKDESIIAKMQNIIMKDISEAYPEIPVMEDDDLMAYIIRINAKTNQQFIFIIDEWDAVCREFKSGTKAMDKYVDWLRLLFKSGQTEKVFAGVYMTGILPIKKYNTQSALNNFIEYSMVEPMSMSQYFGFTKEEVRVLAEKHGMDFDELVKWYDGYQIGDELSMFNPNSVMLALKRGKCESYWARTGATDLVEDYIRYNYEGLRDDIIFMLSGGHCNVDPVGFQNDLSEVNSRDDVLTVLIHLGYLSYDSEEQKCYIPNLEVSKEMETAIKSNNWKEVINALRRSEQLLADTLEGDEEAVAKGVEAVHDDNISIFSYNTENSLSCVVSLAYYYARNKYVVHRELASGKGFADLVLIPRRNVSSPAVVIELKKDATPDDAIAQIRSRDYMAKVREHTPDILLVGISYDTQTKTHTCKIIHN